MLPIKNRTDEAAAELCSRLNDLYDQAADYIYRCLYANIDFTVPSHGPALQATVDREYASERNGPSFYWHLSKQHDKTQSETGQAKLLARVTQAEVKKRLSGAYDSISAESIVYGIHDDWARIQENQSKPICDFIQLIARGMRELAARAPARERHRQANTPGERRVGQA